MAIKDIIILVNTGNCSGRELLRGILRFSSSSHDWRMRICDFADNGEQRARTLLAAGHVDGIITSELESPEIADGLEQATFPLAVIGTREQTLPTRHFNLSNVTSDELAVGALGAQTLLRLGVFNSFGFVNMRHETYRYLSSLRERGFVNHLQKSGIVPYVYDTEVPESESDEAELCAWVRTLPKPTAILAASDSRAEDILRATIHSKLNVPADVSVLGIDDDEFKCLSTSPTLSSINLDAEEQGFQAARQLDKMLRRRTNTVRASHFAGTLTVVQRGSTRTIAPGKVLVSRAKEFIAKNAEKPLSVADVVSFSHVSPRLLFLRFKEFSDQSIQETIHAERIKYFCRRLHTDHGKIRDIARRCGFTNMATLRALFTAHTGMTIRDWRKARRELP